VDSQSSIGALLLGHRRGFALANSRPSVMTTIASCAKKAQLSVVRFGRAHQLGTEFKVHLQRSTLLLHLENSRPVHPGFGRHFWSKLDRFGSFRIK
jgi:hypothetical protein